MHLYIHIPYCISKCDYCDFFSIPLLGSKSNITPDEIHVPEEYIDSLLNEIKFRLNSTKTDSLSTVYIGGGTPSLLLPQQISRIMNFLKKECTLEPNAEVTIEMNPETVTEMKLIACMQNGINRISLGIQSLENNALENVHRHCSSQKAVSALELIKKNWKGHFSVDVIAGLPQTDDEKFLQTVEKLIEYKPDHFSMYSLCIEEETPLGRILLEKSESLTEEIADSADRQWLKGREILKQNGYCQYEVSNFAKKGFEAVHNSAYWKQQDYIGCGAGACGTLYSFGKNVKDKGIRTTNTTDIDKYISFWKKSELNTSEKKLIKNIPQETEVLDVETEEYEFLMMGLRMLSGIDEEIYYERFNSVGETKGILEKRLCQKSRMWKEFVQKNYSKVYKNAHGKNIYALNEEGILFLNPLLESLL